MLLCRGAPPGRRAQADVRCARPGACSRRGGPEALQPPRLRQDRHPIRSPRSVSGRRRPAGGGSQTSACVIQRGGAILPLSAFDRGVRTRRSGHRAPPNSARHRPASCDRGASGGRRALWWLRVCRSPSRDWSGCATAGPARRSGFQSRADSSAERQQHAHLHSRRARPVDTGRRGTLGQDSQAVRTRRAVPAGTRERRSAWTGSDLRRAVG